MTLDTGADAQVWAALSGIGEELSQQRFARENEYGLLASLQLQLGKIGDHLGSLRAEQQREFARRAEEVPIYADLAATVVCPANGIIAFDLGGPAQGRMWHGKRIVIGGLHLNTAAAGSAEVYATGWISDAGNQPVPSSLSDLMDATILVPSTLTQLPNIANYEDGQVVVQAGEHLWVVVRSGTSGQSYVCAATVKDVMVRPPDELVAVGVG